MAQPNRNLVFDPRAKTLAPRQLPIPRQPQGEHRNFHHLLQRDNGKALQMDDDWKATHRIKYGLKLTPTCTSFAPPGWTNFAPPLTDPETGAGRSATGYRSCGSPTTTGPRWATRHLPRDGTATGGRGDGRPTSWRHPTALSWSRTIGPGESTGSSTSVGRRPPIPPNARQGQARWLRSLDLNLALSVI